MSDKQLDAEQMTREIRDNYKKLPSDEEVFAKKNPKREQDFETWYAERMEEEEKEFNQNEG